MAGAVLHGRSDIPGSRCPPAADLQLMRHFVGSVCYVMYRNMGEKYTSTSEISVSTETRTGRTSTASGTARTGHRLINLIVRLAQRPQMGSFLRNAGSQYLLRKASVSLGSSMIEYLVSTSW